MYDMVERLDTVFMKKNDPRLMANGNLRKLGKGNRSGGNRLWQGSELSEDVDYEHDP
jgi:hypothetical protein